MLNNIDKFNETHFFYNGKGRLTYMSVEKYGDSVPQADWVLKNQLLQLSPDNIVDFGAGWGKIGILCREILGQSCHITAIDGYKKAVERLLETNLYDVAECSLIEHWLEKNVKKYDLAIFGDVLEHLKPKSIKRALKRALEQFRYVIIVVPLHDVYQLERYGNKLELHNSYITQNYFDGYPIKEKHIIFSPDWIIMNVLLTADCKRQESLVRKLRKMAHYPLIFLNIFGAAAPLIHFMKRYYLKYKYK